MNSLRLVARPLAVSLCAALITAAPVFAQSPAARPLADTGAKKAAEAITAYQLREYLTFIASDALRGRDTPSQGLEVAGEFIAFHLRRLGLKPGGDNGTFFQNITLSRSAIDAQRSSLTVAGVRLAPGVDYAPDSLGNDAAAEGELVFAGPGALSKLTPENLKGKILVAFTPLTRQAPGAPGTPEFAASSNGAIGVIKIARDPDQASWLSAQATNSTARNRFGGGYRPGNGSASSITLPVLTVSPAGAAKLLADTMARPDPASASETPMALGKSVRMKGGAFIDQVITRNVVAIAEGSDPKLRDEYVAVGAHYDHVGTNQNAAPGTDAIFNGADDDGSGTVSILALASAFAQNRPRRSIIFVWHCGEEKGLWGSDYFTNHPTVPLTQIITQLNIDMIGRSKPAGDTSDANKMLTGPNEIYVVGSKKMSSALGALSDKVNAGYFNLTFNYHYDAPNDPENIFFRSDHYNYARKGIPIIFYFDGVHQDYHQPGDEVQKIDFNKMERICRTVFVTATTLANQSARPAVDKPLTR